MALVDLNLNPDAKQLRTFGLIGLVAFGGLGGWALWKGTLMGFGLGEAQTGVGYGLVGAGALCAALAAVFPKGLKPLFVVLSLITLPIGLVISHVVMILLFYAVISPLGIVMRLTGWDAMERKVDRTEATYWKKRPPNPPVDRYFRQF